MAPRVLHVMPTTLNNVLPDEGHDTEDLQKSIDEISFWCKRYIIHGNMHILNVRYNAND